MPRDELLLGRSEGNPSESPSSGIFFISHWFQFLKMQSQWHLLPCVSKVEQDVFGLIQKLDVQKCTWGGGRFSSLIRPQWTFTRCPGRFWTWAVSFLNLNPRSSPWILGVMLLVCGIGTHVTFLLSALE